MVQPNSANQKTVIDALKQISASKVPTKKVAIPFDKKTEVRQTPQTEFLLENLKANPYSKDKNYEAPKKSAYYTSDINDVFKQIQKPAGFSKAILAPIQLLDTPKRAVISAIRETVDLLDTDKNTKASFGDWFNQTKDVNYGFGTAFPMKGWKGRVVGFLGDVLLDPLTYATLGGTVASKAAYADEVFDATTGLTKTVMKETRGVLGKTVIGREGRQKLAQFTRERMARMARLEPEKFAHYTDDFINEVAGGIVSRGKGTLYDLAPEVAKDMGIKGPGVYYFGSRVKVPGTSNIGQFAENVLNGTRLAMVNTKVGGALQAVATPAGVGKFQPFGEDFIRDARVKLARGGLSPDEVNLNLTMLEIDDWKRVATSQAGEDISSNSKAMFDKLSKKENRNVMHLLLAGNEDLDAAGASLGLSTEQIALGKELRQTLDAMIGDIQRRAGEIGATPPGYITKGYFPIMTSEKGKKFFLIRGEDALDELTSAGRVNSTRYVGPFKERGLEEGDLFFGHVLQKGDNLRPQQLNFYASNPTGEFADWAASRGLVDAGWKGFNFDLFATDIRQVFSNYIQAYSQQVGHFEMLRKGIEIGPDFLATVEKTYGLSPAYLKQVMVDAPKQALEDAQKALWDLSNGAAGGLHTVREALRGLYGDLQTAMTALADGTMPSTDVIALKQAMEAAVLDSVEKTRLYDEALKAFSIENTDNINNFSLIMKQRDDLARELETIKNEITSLTGDVDPKRLFELQQRYSDYSNGIQAFERSMSAYQDVHTVISSLRSNMDLGGKSLYENLRKISDTLAGGKTAQQVAKEWGPASAGTRYPWMSKKVSKMDDAEFEGILSALLIGNMDNQTARDSVDYLFARISQNQFDINGTSLIMKDQMNGAIANEAGQLRIIKSLIENDPQRAARMMQDIWLQQKAWAEYTQMDSILRQYNITIGDDVIDEILARNAEPFILDAIKTGDLERVKQLTTKGFGRKGTDGPFAVGTRLKNERDYLQNLFEESTRRTTGKTPAQVEIAVKKETAELTQLSPTQRKAWGSFKARQQRVFKAVEKQYAELNQELSRIRSSIDETEIKHADIRETLISNFNKLMANNYPGRKEMMRKFLEDSFADIWVPIKRGAEDALKTFDENHSAFMNLLLDNSGKLPANFDITLPENASLYNFFLDNGISFQDLQTSANEIMVKILDDYMKTTGEAALLRGPRNLELRIMQEQVRLLKQKELAESFIGYGPKAFADSDLGAAATETILNDGKKRATKLGMPVVDEVSNSQLVVDELINSDAYPVFKSVESRANAVHSLSAIDGSSVTWGDTGITFTPEEWNLLTWGADLNSGVQGKLARIMEYAKRPEILRVTSPVEFSQVGAEEISSELAVKRLVKYLAETTPGILESGEVVAARRKNILGAWEKTDAYEHLSKINAYRARVIAEKQSQRALDATSSVDGVITRLREVERLASETTANASDHIPLAVDGEEFSILKEYKKIIADLEAQQIESDIKATGKVLDQPQSSDMVSFRDMRLEDPTPNELPTTIEDWFVGPVLADELPAQTGLGLPDAPRFTPSDGPRKPIDIRENIKLGSLKEAEQEIDRILNAVPVEQMTVKQLEEQINLLKQMRLQKISTPSTEGMKSRRLLREREAVLNVRLAQAGEKPLSGVERADIARRVAAVRAERAGLKAKTKEFDEFISTESERIADEFNKNYEVVLRAGQAEEVASKTTTASGTFKLTSEAENVGQAFDQQEFLTRKNANGVEEFILNKQGKKIPNPNYQGQRGDNVVDRLLTAKPVKQSRFTIETQIPADPMNQLEIDLRAAAGRPLEVLDKQAQAAKARAQQAIDAFNAPQNIQDMDPAKVADIQNQLDSVLKMIDDTQIRTTVDINNQKLGPSSAAKAVADTGSGKGSFYDRLEVIKKTMQDAKALAEHIGNKSQVDAIDAVILNQIQLETQFNDAFIRMGEVEFDQRMVYAASNLEKGLGAQLLPDGTFMMPDGTVSDIGLPARAIRQTTKDLKDGWEILHSKYFPGLQVSPEFKTLWDAAARIEDPLWIRALQYYIGDYTKFFKAYVTLSPGFHVRNAIANAMTLTFADAKMENIVKGTPLYFNWLKFSKAGKTWEEYLEFVGRTAPEMVETLRTARLGSLGSGGGIFSSTFKDATAGSRLYDNWLIRLNQSAGQASDNYNRFILAFDSAIRGADSGMAAARVKRYYFDYEDLSKLDKAMRQFIPFWLWTSRNMHMQVTNMWLNPKPYLIYQNFIDNFRGDRPQDDANINPFIAKLGAFKLPFGDGLNFLPDFGFTRIGPTVDDISNPLKLLNQINPVFKVPAEQALGKSFFTGKDFADNQDRLMSALKGVVTPVGQAQRLFGTEDTTQLNAWLSWLGSPVRKYN